MSVVMITTVVEGKEQNLGSIEIVIVVENEIGVEIGNST